ncbi:MAG: hypothetical protein HUU56_14900 [Bdellovibrionaceae bacterium]|nr:hypothetical protein [Pseudobdellovibrionaceae bacterium]
MLLSLNNMGPSNWKRISWTADEKDKKALYRNQEFYGSGFYASEVPTDSTQFGTELLVAVAPRSSNQSKEILTSNSLNRWRLFESPDEQVRFISFKEFLKLLLVSDQLDKMDQMMLVGVLNILRLNPKMAKEYEELRMKIETDKIMSLKWIDDAFFRTQNKALAYTLDSYGRLKKPKTFSGSFQEKPEWLPSWYEDKVDKLEPSISLILLAQRFFDYEHLAEYYKKNLRYAPLDFDNLSASKEFIRSYPFEIYGVQAFKAWLDAYYYIERASLGKLPTLESIKKLHTIVYNEQVGDFISYKRISNNKSQDNYNPRGQLRNGPIYLTSQAPDLNGIRTRFSDEEINRLSKNPNLKVIDRGGKKIVELPYSDSFEQEIEELFKKMRNDTEALEKKKNTLTEIAFAQEGYRIAGELYWEISSRHIFWDGSGRTAKLARDWVLLYLNLQPPLSTTQNDWEMSKEEYVKSLIISSKMGSLGEQTRLFNFSDHYFSERPRHKYATISQSRIDRISKKPDTTRVDSLIQSRIDILTNFLLSNAPNIQNKLDRVKKSLPPPHTHTK